MMSYRVTESLLVYGPIIILIFACGGIAWSVFKKRRYLAGFILLLLGTGSHYWGLHVGRWEGMGISLLYGGGMVLLGLLTLLLTFIYSKFQLAKKNKRRL
ncbi:hypothetical protein [Planococcus rifietoensis]|uniref:hypothetical protein n=1 Tax=Planococcus rifietoensis TaxID=200991 RepID=UPI00384B12B3